MDIPTTYPLAGLGRVVSGNSIRFIELYGGTEVETLFNEPDPNTHRGDYYYNTRRNRLYRKLITKENIYVWKQVS